MGKQAQRGSGPSQACRQWNLSSLAMSLSPCPRPCPLRKAPLAVTLEGRVSFEPASSSPPPYCSPPQGAQPQVGGAGVLLGCSLGFFAQVNGAASGPVGAVLGSALTWAPGWQAETCWVPPRPTGRPLTQAFCGPSVPPSTSSETKPSLR